MSFNKVISLQIAQHNPTSIFRTSDKQVQEIKQWFKKELRDKTKLIQAHYRTYDEAKHNFDEIKNSHFQDEQLAQNALAHCEQVKGTVSKPEYHQLKKQLRDSLNALAEKSHGLEASYQQLLIIEKNMGDAEISLIECYQTMLTQAVIEFKHQYIFFCINNQINFLEDNLSKEIKKRIGNDRKNYVLQVQLQHTTHQLYLSRQAEEDSRRWVISIQKECQQVMAASADWQNEASQLLNRVRETYITGISKAKIYTGKRGIILAVIKVGLKIIEGAGVLGIPAAIASLVSSGMQYYEAKKIIHEYTEVLKSINFLQEKRINYQHISAICLQPPQCYSGLVSSSPTSELPQMIDSIKIKASLKEYVSAVSGEGLGVVVGMLEDHVNFTELLPF